MSLKYARGTIQVDVVDLPEHAADVRRGCDFFSSFFAFLSFFFRFVKREPADAEQKYFSGDAACRLLKSGCGQLQS